MRTIGLIGGNHSAARLMYSVDFAEIKSLQHEGDWPGLTARMIDAGRRLAAVDRALGSPIA